MYEAVILVGGENFKLRAGAEVPKPYLIINPDTGQTLLEKQVAWLISNGVEHIVLAISRENFKYTRTNYTKFLRVPFLDYSIEEKPMGTVQALKNALQYVEEKNFYCMNVDDFCDYDVKELFNVQCNSNAILVKQEALPYGEVITDETNSVIDYNGKLVSCHLISTGHYVFNRDVIMPYLSQTGNLEDSMLKSLAKDGLLNMKVLKGEWVTVNNQRQLEKAKYLFSYLDSSGMRYPDE